MEPNWQDQSKEPTELEPPATAWPKVIGVLSLTYGILGVLCQTGSGVMTFFTGPLMKMIGMDIPVPTAMKAAAAGTVVMSWILGIVLIVGSVRLLRRARSAISLLKGWAVARLVMLAIGIGGAILIMPATNSFGKQMVEEQNRLAREAGRPEETVPTDEEQRMRDLLLLGGFSALTAAYPLFLGFYLSRRKIKEEVAHWV